MSEKKILVIEDWDKFKQNLHTTLRCTPLEIHQSVLEEILKHEPEGNVIEFEATAIEYSPPSEDSLGVWFSKQPMVSKKKFAPGDKFKFFGIKEDA